MPGMSTRRFYCPDLQPGQTELAGTDAHHLLHVLRLEPGQQVQLFDGQGRLANAQISQLARKTVVLTIASITQPPDHRIQLVLATALPKYSRQQWLLEKCTELGVDKLIPLQCRRSVAGKSFSNITFQRWTRWTIEASKQSERLFLPQISAKLKLDKLLEKLSDYDLSLVGSPDRRSVSFGDIAARAHRTNNVLIIVGPEGGFADHEIDAMAQAGVTFVRLGCNVLRTETAAAALLAAVVALRDPQ